MISFYSHLDIWLTKDYHWVMAAGIMCLYSQDNIQTLSTHSPTFVWEGRSEKEIRGILTMDNSTIDHFEVKARTQRKTNKCKLVCRAIWGLLWELSFPLHLFPPNMNQSSFERPKMEAKLTQNSNWKHLFLAILHLKVEDSCWRISWSFIATRTMEGSCQEI